MSRWYRRNPDGSLSLFVHAQPGAKRTEVAGLHGDALKIRVAAPALEDRANDALIGFIAKQLGISKRDVELISGAKSREKRFEIRDCAADPNRLVSEH
jgi:uncharacterized protein (TIGR00251 family)